MYVYKKGTVSRQTYPLFKTWAMRSRRSGSWALRKYYIGYIYKFTCTKIRLFLSIPIHLNTKYIYIMPEACDFFDVWWRVSSSLVVHHDSHFVY